jgi:hypothetical protein
VREGGGMTIVGLLIHLVHLFAHFGAHHVYASKQGANGYAVTRHFLVVVCHIHAGHGTFHCSGSVTR